MHAQSLSCVQHFCDPMDYNLDMNPMDMNLPGSTDHGIFQARVLEWVAFTPPGDLTGPGIELHLAGPGIELHLLHLLYWQDNSLPLSHLENLAILQILLNQIINIPDD